MSIIKGVLKESRAYYADVERKIKKLIKELPQGNIKKRRIGKKTYWYLQRRAGKKVLHKYVGKEKPLDLIGKLAERKRLVNELGNVRLSKKIIEKANKVKSVRSK